MHRAIPIRRYARMRRTYLWVVTMMRDEPSPDPNRIIRDPRILLGKPVVKGTRIPVEVVLDYLAHNPNFAELFADYPRLTMDDVQACLGYATAIVHRQTRWSLASRFLMRE